MINPRKISNEGLIDKLHRIAEGSTDANPLIVNPYLAEALARILEASEASQTAGKKAAQ